eukprot:3469087-Prymnesium_polylepis.1
MRRKVRPCSLLGNRGRGPTPLRGVVSAKGTWAPRFGFIEPRVALEKSWARKAETEARGET